MVELNQTFEKYKTTWKNVALALDEQTDLGDITSELTEYFSDILELTDRAVTKETPKYLGSELMRIYSRVMRRFFAISQISHNGYTDLLGDELRSSLEMMFQVFFLLRTENPTQAVIDARNLSGISWWKAGDRFFSDRSVSRPQKLPDDYQIAMDKVLVEYKGRRARFYGDLSVLDVAEKAGLKHIYIASYNWLSAHSHNEPISEISTLSKKDDGLEIALIPNEKDLKRYGSLLSLFCQICTLTSLGCLSRVCDVNTDKMKKFLSKIRVRYKGFGWDKEIETVYKNWGIDYDDNQ